MQPINPIHFYLYIRLSSPHPSPIDRFRIAIYLERKLRCAVAQAPFFSSVTYPVHSVLRRICNADITPDAVIESVEQLVEAFNAWVSAVYYRFDARSGQSVLLSAISNSKRT